MGNAINNVVGGKNAPVYADGAPSSPTSHSGSPKAGGFGAAAGGGGSGEGNGDGGAGNRSGVSTDVNIASYQNNGSTNIKIQPNAYTTHNAHTHTTHAPAPTHPAPTRSPGSANQWSHGREQFELIRARVKFFFEEDNSSKNETILQAVSTLFSVAQKLSVLPVTANGPGVVGAGTTMTGQQVLSAT